MKQESILIIQTAFLGDLILTTPFIHAVRNLHPNAKIHMVVAKGTESVLSGNPSVDGIYPFDKKIAKKSIRYFFSFMKEIRGLKPDRVYSPHFSYRSSLMSFFSGAKIRIGYKESGFSFLHTETVSRPRTGRHEVDKLFSLLFKDESAYPKGRDRRPFLYPSEDIQISAIQKLQHVLSNSNGYITICPSSVWETKKYLPEGFSELLKLILERTKYSIVLTGGPGDTNLNQKILNDTQDRIGKETWERASHRVLNLAGLTSLPEMSVVIRESKAVVTNDSSPVHYASAFNRPTVMIYGATVPDFGYYGLMEKLSIAEIHGLSCRPCGIHGGNVCPAKHFRCMNEQSPESLFQKLIEVLKD